MNKITNISPQIIIKLGEQGTAFTRRYPDQVYINRQPAGVDFYKIRWNNGPRGNVLIEHDPHSFTIDNVFSLSGTYDNDLPAEGLANFSLNAGVTEPELISHDQARLKTYAILQKIAQAGWKIITSLDTPRLQGKSRLDYVLNGSSYIGLDLNYIPDLEEWMRINNDARWMFYANHAYLEVTFDREGTLIDSTKTGAYLLSFDIQTEADYFRNYVRSEDRLHWQNALPVELAKLAPIRAQKEAELRAKGIKIDETYRDPPLPDLK